MASNERHGVTLIELAIVLVIIALIIGGILTGRTLIRGAQVQSVMDDVSKYTKSMQMFRDKYYELPGDMPNATSFWGAESPCPPIYTSSPHVVTCNGNGDSFIGDTAGTTYAEWYRAWQHMADAGLLEGGFNGMSGTGSAFNSLVGVNVPPSKVPLAGYTLSYQPPTSGSASAWAGNYGHVFYFGTAVTNSYTYGAVLTPLEAQMLDVKMDDGIPSYGLVVAAPSGRYPNCTTSDTASSSQYNTTYTQVACGLVFLAGF